MDTNIDAQAVMKIVREELPELIKTDQRIRQLIIEMSREQVLKEEGRTTAGTEADSRFDRILDELKRNREEEYKKWHEQAKKWAENQEEIRQIILRVEKLQQRHDATLGSLGARWGFRSEASFRNALKGILENFDIEVLHVNEYDDKGEVFGRPDQVELNIIIINGQLIIGELKSSLSKADIHIFHKKACFYEKRHERKADRLIVISSMVDDPAHQLAEKLDIKVYSYADEVEKDLLDEQDS